VSPTVIENVVGTRQGKPSYDVFEKVCANANVSPEWLLTGDGPMLRSDGPPVPPEPSSLEHENAMLRGMVADKDKVIASQEKTIARDEKLIAALEHQIGESESGALGSARSMDASCSVSGKKSDHKNPIKHS
jgi:hypothetical protein